MYGSDSLSGVAKIGRRMRLAVLLLVVISFYCSLSNGSDEVICDNGKYKIEEDNAGEDGSCEGERFVIKEFLRPAGVSYCEQHPKDGEAKCMNEELHYSDTPPLSGDHRLVAPQYGDYTYLPPQRWLHVLKYGAVVFLYHPCAPLDQVIAMKEILSGCLRKHVVTPYPQLSGEKPLALVSLGCIYNMSWVDKGAVEEWIQSHALHTAKSVVTQDGEYNFGLSQPASIVSDIKDSTICPSLVTIEPPDLTTPTNNQSTTDAPVDNVTPHHTHLTTPTNCTNDCPSVTNHVTVVYFIQHHVLLVCIFVLSLALFLLLLSIWICYLRRSRAMRERRRRVIPGKYKPMENFFPRSGGVMGIAIPEMGLPKAMPSEREKLILESDEDEL